MDLRLALDRQPKLMSLTYENTPGSLENIEGLMGLGILLICTTGHRMTTVLQHFTPDGTLSHSKAAMMSRIDPGPPVHLGGDMTR